MSKSPKLHGLPILFVTNCLYPSELQNGSVRNGYFTQNLSKSERHILVWNALIVRLQIVGFLETLQTGYSPFLN